MGSTPKARRTRRSPAAPRPASPRSSTWTRSPRALVPMGPASPGRGPPGSMPRPRTTPRTRPRLGRSSSPSSGTRRLRSRSWFAPMPAARARGAFSVEVQTDGADRAFLRGSTGRPTVLLGSAGSIAARPSLHHRFQVGHGRDLARALGRQRATWSRPARPTRSPTASPGTSPIRFGAWHTDVDQHDGPYGRVVWLNRRISDTEEADLARARTISHSSGVSEYVTTPEAERVVWRQHRPAEHRGFQRRDLPRRRQRRQLQHRPRRGRAGPGQDVHGGGQLQRDVEHATP